MSPVVYEPQQAAPSPDPEAQAAWTSSVQDEQAFTQSMANAHEFSGMQGLYQSAPASALPAERLTQPAPDYPWQPPARHPSFGDSQFGQHQRQLSPDVPSDFEPDFQGPCQGAQVVADLCSVGATSPLPRLPFRDSQERSSQTASLSSDDVFYNAGHMLSASVSAPPTTYLGQLSPASGQSVTGYGQLTEEAAPMHMPQDPGQMAQGLGQVPQGQGHLEANQMQAFQPVGSRSSSLVLPGHPVGCAREGNLRHSQSDKTNRRTRRNSSTNDLRGKCKCCGAAWPGCHPMEDTHAMLSCVAKPKQCK